MHSLIINEHNKGLDDLVDQEDQLGGDECDVEEEIDIDCSIKDILGCVGSNLASPVDASSAQAVRGTNLPHSSGSNHDSVLQKKEDKIGRHAASLKKKEDLCFHIYCQALHYWFSFFLVWMWNDFCWGKDMGSSFDIVVLCSDIIILVR
uniref:Uncharacterized protein n=1 Tax=Solanum tuberosum TaxID=4113 RepID=M1DWE1_SOLTU